MSAIDKAIWYIENHYRDQVTLDAIAAVAGVSRYHLSRMFCYAVGQPISRYIRLRRLSRAALALADGEPDILDLALSLGYGSHESFSRAFKQHFCRTPEQVRRQGHTDGLQLMEATLMHQTRAARLAEPRLEAAGALRLAGISRFYPFKNMGEVPDQWQSFAPLIPRITNEADPVTYGVIYNGRDDSFDYLSGVELPGRSPAPENLVCLSLAAQTYLVFQHQEHVSAVRATCDAIWSDWLPDSDETVVEAPWFERYGKAFDPRTGAGGLEIWIPVAR